MSRSVFESCQSLDDPYPPFCSDRVESAFVGCGGQIWMICAQACSSSCQLRR
jgi:hypothetical protein